jgi:pimeloyl-ACP methyl ester carboxylesterase
MTMTATFETRFRSVDGVQVRYAEGGRPDGPTVLLTSPWPESVYAFASIWDSLAAQYGSAVLESLLEKGAE